MSFYSPVCTLCPYVLKSIDESIKKEREWLSRKPPWWRFKKRKIWLSENPNNKYYYTRKECGLNENTQYWR